MSDFARRRLNRRQVLQAGAAAGLLPFIHARGAAAETAVGNWPAGVSGATAFVGITIPLTGPYSADGNDLLKGYQLAIEQLNNGGGVVSKQPHLTGKGVLGKKIVSKYADTQTQPNPAVQAQTTFISQNKAIMITGSLSSAVAIAIEKLAQRNKVLNMVGCSGANETTGADCVRYAFRNQPSAYMADLALAPVLGKHLGKNLKAAYLVPDYVYGHSVFDTLSDFMDKKYGWKMATQQVAPLGTTNFSSYLLNIANSGADVFVNITFGADAVSSTKQAAQFGLMSKMKQVQPNASAFLPDGVGAELMQNTYATMDFWWKQAEKDPMAKIFVDDFKKKYNYNDVLGRGRRAGQDLRSGPGHQDAGERLQTRPAGRRNLVPLVRSPSGARCPGGSRQEAERDDVEGRLLRNPGTRPRRTGYAAQGLPGMQARPLRVTAAGFREREA
jgi:branched-chain amino acid transport system substrate-binding protein